MQLTASNTRNFTLILYNVSNGAERLWLVRSLDRKFPWAAHALRAEELQREQKNQSDLDIDNSSVSAVHSQRCAEISSVSQAVSYGQF